MGNRYGIQIRAAVPADAPGVAELLASVGHRVDAAVLATRLEALRQHDATVLLALEWGPPSGLIALNWIQTLVADHPVAQIGALLVGPEDRRRGIGRLLLKAGAQAARSAGCDDLVLSTSRDDTSLRAFGTANGFEDMGSLLVRPLRKRG